MTVLLIALAIAATVVLFLYVGARKQVGAKDLVKTEGFKKVLLDIEKWLAIASTIGFLTFIPFAEVSSIIDFVQENTDAAVQAATVVYTIALGLWAELRQAFVKKANEVATAGISAKGATRVIEL